MTSYVNLKYKLYILIIKLDLFSYIHHKNLKIVSVQKLPYKDWRIADNLITKHLAKASH